MADATENSAATDHSVSRERDARVVWSAIAEPSDAAAGFLVDTLGADAALAWVRGAWDDPVTATATLTAHMDDRTADAAVKAAERWRARARDVRVEELYRRTARADARIVVPGDRDWPSALDSLGPTRPFALWVRGRGDLAALMARSLAIVGARAATAYGEHVASGLAVAAADAGWTTVSGGAYGIDAAAHRGALAAFGPSVAFLAGGVDRLYPAGNAELLTRLLEEGAVVSEVPPGWAPHRSRFLSRNRLIASATMTVVVEAALRSGALSTARHAAALYRPLGAVPGPVTSAASSGCHALLREGVAAIVTGFADCQDLAGAIGDGAQEEVPAVDPNRIEFADSRDRQVYDALGNRRRDVGELSVIAALTPGEVRSSLGRMEGSGLVEQEGGLWRRQRAGSRLKVPETGEIEAKICD